MNPLRFFDGVCPRGFAQPVCFTEQRPEFTQQFCRYLGQPVLDIASQAVFRVQLCQQDAEGGGPVADIPGIALT